MVINFIRGGGDCEFSLISGDSEVIWGLVSVELEGREKSDGS